MAVRLAKSCLRPISLDRTGQIIRRAVSGKAVAQFNNPGCDRGQCLQGGHWSWVGARVSDFSETSKTLGLGMVLVVIQILGRGQLMFPFWLRLLLGAAGLRKLAARTP